MNSISRSAFLALDHVAQMSHIRSGAAIVDDAPIRGPYDDIPFILDGRQRLSAIQERDAMTKRISDENAKIDAELAEAKATLARWSAER
jgi:hypothetical protein